MGIELMSVWKKLLANARIRENGFSRGGHHNRQIDRQPDRQKPYYNII